MYAMAEIEVDNYRLKIFVIFTKIFAAFKNFTYTFFLYVTALYINKPQIQLAWNFHDW